MNRFQALHYSRLLESAESCLDMGDFEGADMALTKAWQYRLKVGRKLVSH